MTKSSIEHRSRIKSHWKKIIALNLTSWLLISQSQPHRHYQPLSLVLLLTSKIKNSPVTVDNWHMVLNPNWKVSGVAIWQSPRTILNDLGLGYLIVLIYLWPKSLSNGNPEYCHLHNLLKRTYWHNYTEKRECNQYFESTKTSLKRWPKSFIISHLLKIANQGLSLNHQKSPNLGLSINNYILRIIN